MTNTVERLFEAFQPQKYTLTITGDDKNMTFSGSVCIEGTLVAASQNIKLHAAELDITYASINSDTVTVDTDAAAQTITLTSSKKLSARTIIELGFTGKITKPMHGLYPCFYDHEGTKKILLATQFESHHAREVFPCIDEPEAKAIFSLTIGSLNEHSVVSNTPVKKNWSQDNIYYTDFEDTPRMSSYLLAWVAGELVYEEATTSHGILVRAYSTPVHAGKAAYSLDVATKALDFMDDYFGIPYPLFKCDIIALPDFAAGAMENWGCITFRESAMLVDPEQSDLSDKQHVADVVTHELAHQWFGNLVTMRWWDDLWLNEGFASWIPYLVLDNLYPEWNVWEQFSTGDLMVGMRADALENSHPIVVTINSPEEIRSAFDSISYDKGCSVINLLHRYIGPDAFQKGLHNYLQDHAYGNAETSDLWSAWSKSSGKDVQKFMKTWTTTKGFPIVQATANGTGLDISQKRFLLNSSASQEATIWPIPLIQSATDDTIFDIEHSTTQKIQKLNLGQSGFYRVIYDAPAIQTILASEPNPVDMLGLINDASEAAKAGYHSTTEALDLIKSVNTSTNEPLIGIALGELAGIRTVLSESYEAMKPFVGTFIEHNYARLGIDKSPNDTVDDELLRPMILGAASYSGRSVVVQWALDTFAAASSPEDIRPEVRSVIFSTAVREIGGVEVYDKLLSWYETNTIPGEQITLASALTNFRDPELISRTLLYISSDKVKLQDSLYWIAYSLAGRYSKNQAWDWLKTHWDWIGANFGKEKEIDYYLRYAANGFASADHLADYTEFFSKVDIFGSARAFEQGKETITWQSAWKNRDEAAVVKWLESL